MKIGRLDRKITIEERTDSQNTLGEPVAVWSTYHQAFANVQKAGGSENTRTGSIVAENRVKFKIRFFDGITEDMRIVYNGNYYDILQIQELNREGLWITASKQY